MRSQPGVLTILLLVILVAFPSCANDDAKKLFTGFFYANDSGESHGGFEWAGEYTASLEVTGKDGILTLTLSTGLGDPLTRHQFSVAEFVEVGDALNLRIEGQSALLSLVDNDRIWQGKYNGYYSGNKSSNSSEQVGLLPIGVFTGFSAFYYIDLRLKRL
jgi:hypothetical protein